VIDARMGEIYAGAFRRGSDSLVAPIMDEMVGRATEFTFPQSKNWSVLGSGWAAYAEALAARLPAAPRFADGTRFPQARAIARLAQPQFAAGQGVSPEYALPVYLRDKVALTLEEQRAR
jgi:tRNA threonylcarbamoyladenosine biosynthesis protein TsaB